MSLAPHRVDVFLGDVLWIRSCLSLELCRELRKPLTQRPLFTLSLKLTAQRMGDRLGHISVAQFGELTRELTDLRIANADTHGALVYTISLDTYIRKPP